MALDIIMANSYASSATVRVMVSFYPVSTDDTYSSSARSDQNLDDPQRKIKCSAKRLRNPTLRVNASEKSLRSRLPYRALSSYWGTQSYSFFAGTLKNTRKFKISLGQFTIYSLAFVEIWLLNVFSDEKLCGMQDSREKRAGMRDQDPSFQILW